MQTEVMTWNQIRSHKMTKEYCGFQGQAVAEDGDKLELSGSDVYEVINGCTFKAKSRL